MTAADEAGNWVCRHYGVPPDLLPTSTVFLAGRDLSTPGEGGVKCTQVSAGDALALMLRLRRAATKLQRGVPLPE